MKNARPKGLTIFMAGVEGFEPPNAGTRNQCLTTWRHPIGSKDCTPSGPTAQVVVINTFFSHIFTFYTISTSKNVTYL